MAHVTRSKPNLVEVARSLRASGHLVTALDLVRAVGIKEIPMPTAEPEVKKPKYVREKVRYAFIHVVADVPADQQQHILTEFRNKAQETETWLPELDAEHLLKIALPGKVVVYAYRVPLDRYLKSTLPAVLQKTKILEAYTRKPRADAQHHAAASAPGKV